MKEFFKKLKTVDAMVFDLDGVLTDGSLLLLEDGEMLRKMNIKDCYALFQAVEKKYKIAIVSDEGSDAVSLRLENLGVKEIFYNVPNEKKNVFESFLLKHSIDIKNALYMGDDITDIEAMTRAGITVCPKDAASEVINISDYVTNAKGGNGCVREIIEMVMKVQGEWI